MLKITLTPTTESVEVEVGSASEGIAFIEENGAGLTRLLEVLGRLDKAEGQESVATAEPAARRGRPKKNAGGDPVTAIAPAPIAVPGAPPAPVAPAPPSAPAAPGGTDGLAIPPFLDRTAPQPSAPPTPAAAPPPPPAPVAAPPPAPPTGVLAEKIIAELEKRKISTPEAPQQLADWLASCKLVIPGATYDEAIAVLRLAGDEKLQPLLQPLGL